jgi:hypothetical protein
LRALSFLLAATYPSYLFVFDRFDKCVITAEFFPSSVVKMPFFRTASSLNMFSAYRQQSATNSWLSSGCAGWP